MIPFNEYIEKIRNGKIIIKNIINQESSFNIELNSVIPDCYEFDIESKFVYNLIIYNIDNIKHEKLLKYIPRLNTDFFGYYPKYINIVDKYDNTNSYIFDEKYLDMKYKKIIIRFEAIYETDEYKNTTPVPEFAYYLALQKNKDIIKEDGIYNSRLNKIVKNYMFYNQDDYINILSILKKENNREYMLLKIKLSDYFFIHTDINYKEQFYIFDNICYNRIEIIKENL